MLHVIILYCCCAQIANLSNFGPHINYKVTYLKLFSELMKLNEHFFGAQNTPEMHLLNTQRLYSVSFISISDHQLCPLRKSLTFCEIGLLSRWKSHKYMYTTLMSGF